MEYSHPAFWTEFYNSNTCTTSPSEFAQFIDSTYLQDPNVKFRMCDLGCGNRRDANYFVSCGHIVTAVDPSQPVVELKNPLLRTVKKPALDALNLRDLSGLQDMFYMRWFIHSMPYKEGKEVFTQAARHLKPGGVICIEVRSQKDEVLVAASTHDASDDSYMTDHKRWLYTAELLTQYADVCELDVLQCEESRGWSKTALSDPVLIRFVARRPMADHFKQSPNLAKFEHKLEYGRCGAEYSYPDMVKFHKFAADHGIKYIPVAGTLLGLLRHGGIAPWDDDIDLGFTDDEMDRVWSMKVELEEAGIPLTVKLVKAMQDANGNVIHTRINYLDIFRMQPEKEYLIGVAHTKCRIEDAKHLVPQKFGPCVINAPIELVPSVVERYGERALDTADLNDGCHGIDPSNQPFQLTHHDRSFHVVSLE